MLFYSSIFVKRLGILLRATTVVTFFILAFLLSSSIAQPAEVTLAWDAISEPNVGGYKLYCGQASREYNFYVDLGNTLTGTLTDLRDETTYYVAVTAYDASGYESDFSNEVQINLIPPEPKTVLAINCGGPQYVDAEGNVYQADTFFAGGQTYTALKAIEETEDDILYQSERFGDFSYQIPLPNQNYTVTLKFAEVYYGGPEYRIFNVKILGETVLSNFDIFSQVGEKYKAYDISFPVSITDGMLTIETQDIVGNPKLSAIFITKN